MKTLLKNYDSIALKNALLNGGMTLKESTEIVRAVNSHEELLQTLNDIERRLSKGVIYGPGMSDSFRVCAHDALNLAKRAIAKAEGK